MKWRLNHGLDPQLYYYRDAQKNEIDLIFKNGNELIPIEIKSSRTFHPDFLKMIRFFQDLAGSRAPKGFLIYAGDQEQRIGAISLLNYKRSILSISPDAV